MKKELILIILTLFLISFVTAIDITGSAVNNNSGNQNNENGSITASGQNNDNQESTQNTGKSTKLKNRLKNFMQEGECAENCTCTGSVMKCNLKGGREMTIHAGKSGNVIVQTKGINMSTNVELYKSNGTLYGVFKNNKTKEIKVLPDQVQEKIREKMGLLNCSSCSEVSLDEDGNYIGEAEQQAKFLGFIKINKKVTFYINSETGEVTKVKKSWWSFLAKDSTDNLVVGASCGTVSPDSRDECCQNKEFDYYDANKNECLNTASQ
jgi:hypothetical protein